MNFIFSRGNVPREFYSRGTPKLPRVTRESFESRGTSLYRVTRKLTVALILSYTVILANVVLVGSLMNGSWRCAKTVRQSIDLLAAGLALSS